MTTMRERFPKKLAWLVQHADEESHLLVPESHARVPAICVCDDDDMFMRVTVLFWCPSLVMRVLA